MENIFELIGDVITFDGDKYYAFDIKERGQIFYCLGINVNSQSFDEGMQILEISLKSGELRCGKYNGDEYQSLLNEFLEPENFMQCLQFIGIQKDVLSKENKESQRK